jgi:hypothetical protein
VKRCSRRPGGASPHMAYEETERRLGVGLELHLGDTGLLEVADHRQAISREPGDRVARRLGRACRVRDAETHHGRDPGRMEVGAATRSGTLSRGRRAPPACRRRRAARPDLRPDTAWITVPPRPILWCGRCRVGRARPRGRSSDHKDGFFALDRGVSRSVRPSARGTVPQSHPGPRVEARVITTRVYDTRCCAAAGGGAPSAGQSASMPAISTSRSGLRPGSAVTKRTRGLAPTQVARPGAVSPTSHARPPHGPFGPSRSASM